MSKQQAELNIITMNGRVIHNQGSRLTFCNGAMVFLGAPAQKLGAPKFSYRQY